MLSERDQRLAEEIGFQVRYGGPHGGLSSDMPQMPAVLAWPLAILCAWFSYLMRDWHSLFWGMMLFLSLMFLCYHAEYRHKLFESNRNADLALLFLYSAIFSVVLYNLWHREYWILSAVCSLVAFITIISLILPVFRRQY